MQGFRSAAILLLFLCLSHLASGLEAHGTLLKILHTNDLHSHMNHAEDPGVGGYAAVKGLLDELREESRAQQIETLTLDAGDFTEGSIYYLADYGAGSWRAMSAMGYDAVALGNHDWLMGERELNHVVNQVRPSFPVLAANFIFSAQSAGLARHFKQTAEFRRAGIKIGVLGLTTDELLFNWAMEDSGGFINSAEDEARRQLPGLRARNDLVIALTHLGVKADRRVAERVGGIDLVVGGHSHTTLAQAELARAPDGRTVPIVQTGMHGQFVGEILLDVQPGKPVQMLSYRLVPVRANGPRDASIDRIVAETNERIESEYGRDWLNEVIGQAEVPLENPAHVGHATVWGSFAAEAMRQAGQAEAAVDTAEFVGQGQPAGPVTRRQLFVLYPRMFDLERRHGWNVWTVDVQGRVLKLALQKGIEGGATLDLAGISFSPSGDLLIQDRPVQSRRFYRVAVPEGIVRGGFGISSALKAILRHPRDTGVPVWDANERLLRAVKVIR
jgi:5'-nucleotidase/UDP-sugar diphosphatase